VDSVSYNQLLNVCFAPIVYWRIVIRAVLLTLGLFVLWLLMSGIYEPLTIGFGAASSILCVWIISRLEILGKRGITRDVSLFRFFRYLFWLVVEIGKADLAVTKVILAKTLPKRQRLIFVPAKQRSDFGKMMFANSITITPGTITVETEPDHFIVHALTDEAADLDALANMGDRVCEIEQKPASQS